MMSWRERRACRPEICRRWEAGESTKALAAEFGCTITTIRRYTRRWGGKPALRLDIKGRTFNARRETHAALDDIIGDHLGRAWISSMDLHRAVERTYGPVNRRVFYRHMRLMRDAEAVAFELRWRQYFYRRKAVSLSR